MTDKRSRCVSCAQLLMVAGLFAASNTVQAQIIDESTEFSATKPPSRIDTGIELFSDVRYGINALSASNLPGGFDEDPIADTVWVKGVSAYASHTVADKVALGISASAFHVNFFEHSVLNFVGARAGVGAVYLPSTRALFYAQLSCSGEFDPSSLKRYYSHCGPALGTRLTLGAPRKFHVALTAGGYLALGNRNRMARYKEGNVRLTFSTGGKVRFAIEPGASVRKYTTPGFFPADLRYDRTDYTGSVPVSLTYMRDRWEFGLVAEPSISWSTDANFRSWDARFGPSLKVRF